MGDIWGYVCHKNGEWGGCCTGDRPKKELRKFLGEFAADGWTVTPVATRAEYNALLDTLKPYSPKRATPESAPR